MRLAAMVVLSVLAGPAFASATGRIVDRTGSPVPGAQVCEFVENSPEHCVIADRDGAYRMESPTRDSLLVRAKGFISQKIEAVPLSEPVRLQPAAVLLVTVVDAQTGKPLSSGRVMLDSPSGRRIGESVPFNRSGVRISTLDPGVVFVRVDAEGYDPSGPIPADLVSGAEKSVKVRLKRAAKTSP